MDIIKSYVGKTSPPIFFLEKSFQILGVLYGWAPIISK